MSQIEELITECENMEKETGSRAIRLKVLSVFFNIFIIISGSVIGVFSMLVDNIYVFWITLVFGFLISLIKIITTSFKIENKSLSNMQISIKMRQFIRKLKKIRRRVISEDEIEEALDKLGKEFDDLRLSVFTDGCMKRVNTIARKSPTTSISQSSDDNTQVINIDV